MIENKLHVIGHLIRYFLSGEFILFGSYASHLRGYTKMPTSVDIFFPMYLDHHGRILSAVLSSFYVGPDKHLHGWKFGGRIPESNNVSMYYTKCKVKPNTQCENNLQICLYIVRFNPLISRFPKVGEKQDCINLV